MAYQPDDLTEIEVAFLGVLSVGLPPSRAAGDDTFRVDHVTAVVHGLRGGLGRSGHLAGDGPRTTPEFREQLRAAIDHLASLGIVAAPPAGMPAAAGGFEAGIAIDLVDPDAQPAVLDRHLGQLCMERLLGLPAVYPYLMERYARSGEVWRRLRDDGYAG